MEYKNIQPPFTLRFQDMSREKAEAYFAWFMDQIPVRVSALEQAVQSTVGYEDWRANYTPESLEKLGQWLCEQVETRERKKVERETIYSRAPAWFKNVEIEDWELTNRTFSLALDTGMYFSRVFEENLSGVKWVMVKKPRNDADFQQPVLVGTGRLGLNPVRILVTYVYGIARRSKGPERLRELYNTWANLLVG
jgi:hypothetical protein